MRSEFISRAIEHIKTWDDDPLTTKLFTIYYKRMLRAHAYDDCDLSPESIAEMDYEYGFIIDTREDIANIWGEVDPERINAEANGYVLYLVDGLEA